MPIPRLLVLFGPTASGKSALALAAARAFAGVVINADSMQIYRELPILSAAPTVAEQAAVPHRLYGVLSAAELCSAARWRTLALAEIEAAWAAGRLPIVVGGTGLYLNALLKGLSPIPDIPESVRADSRALLAQLGAPGLHARLAEADPVTAVRLNPGDSQRLARAWEVFAATGRSLTDWQAEPLQGALPAPALLIALEPERETLYRTIDQRFAAMIQAGALDEVRAVSGFDPALPALKALGIPDLRRHLSGEVSLEAAVTAAQAATRHYAKRQVTWARHQLPGDPFRWAAQFSESLWPKIFPIIRQFLLTE